LINGLGCTPLNQGCFPYQNLLNLQIKLLNSKINLLSKSSKNN